MAVLQYREGNNPNKSPVVEPSVDSTAILLETDTCTMLKEQTMSHNAMDNDGHDCSQIPRDL